MAKRKQENRSTVDPQKPSYETLELEIRHLNEMIAELSQKIAGQSVDIAHAQAYGKRMEKQARLYQERLQALETESAE